MWRSVLVETYGIITAPKMAFVLAAGHLKNASAK
jgi:hypothetical protein